MSVSGEAVLRGAQRSASKSAIASRRRQWGWAFNVPRLAQSGYCCSTWWCPCTPVWSEVLLFEECRGECGGTQSVVGAPQGKSEGEPKDGFGGMAVVK